MPTFLQQVPHLGKVLLLIESGWRDFVRGHTVGQQRRLGFFGSFPFLLLMRWAMLFAVGVRVDRDTRNGGSAISVLLAMCLLALLDIPLTYSYRHRKHDLAQWAFILSDLALITYLVLWRARRNRMCFCFTCYHCSLQPSTLADGRPSRPLVL